MHNFTIHNHLISLITDTFRILCYNILLLSHTHRWGIITKRGKYFIFNRRHADLIQGLNQL